MHINEADEIHLPDLHSEITFMYFKELAEPARFMEEVLQLELVDDQGFARIYRVGGGGFIGIVDEAKGHHRAQDDNAVLITLVVDEVQPWHERLNGMGLRMLSGIKTVPEANVECFFFVGPGGYHFEIQKFLDPEVEARFKLQPA